MSARRALPAAIVVGALAAAAPAPAATVDVTMPARFFSPGRVTALMGDTVRWTNTSAERHVVDGPGFGSGDIDPGTSYSQSFAAAGSIHYICTIHRFMAGEIDVVPATLEGPAGRVARGSAVTLQGRVPEGTPDVAIDALAPDGTTTPVADVVPRADGTFAVGVAPQQSTSYVATVDAGSSPAVNVQVADPVALVLRPRLRRDHIALSASVSPAQPGAVLALQVFSKDRYAWRQVAHVRLGADGTARFALSRRVRRTVRLALRDAHGGAVLATSRPVRAWLVR